MARAPRCPRTASPTGAMSGGSEFCELRQPDWVSGQDGLMPTVGSFLLREVTDEVTHCLATLLPEVSSSAEPVTRERVDEVVGSDSTRIVVATLDDQIRGMALLCICRTLKGRFGLVEEVAVDADARGHRLGVEVMVRLLEVAHDERLDFVELTSRPSREAANGLYQSLGFEQRETNVYRHHLTDLPTRR